MPLSSVVTNFYYAPGQSPSISAELSEFSEGYTTFPFPAISAELSELLNSIPMQGISAEMLDTLPELLILRGIDQATGQERLFTPGDTIVKSNGSLYLSSTGLRGFSGISGATGLSGSQGTTGLFTGATGIRGLSGLGAIQGITGLQGTTGIVGITGTHPTQGATGISATGIAGIMGIQVSGNTGVQGLTGFFGITGISPSGITGLQGDTGLLGNTGLQGITGVAPDGPSPQGATGIEFGATGILGNTGLVGIGGIETVYSLNAATSSVASSLNYTLLANTLDTNEQQLEVIAWGLSSTAGIASVINLTLGGSTLLSQNISGPAGNSFYIRSLIIRVTTTTQENNTYIISQNSTLAQRTATSIDFSLDQLVEVSVTSPEGQQFIYGLLIRKVTQN